MDNEDFNDEDIIASINVIPFIDVVLVLLIIFISFKPALEVLETNLPESNKSSIIDITNNDFYLINIKPNVVTLLMNYPALKDGVSESETKLNRCRSLTASNSSDSLIRTVSLLIFNGSYCPSFKM